MTLEERVEELERICGAITEHFNDKSDRDLHNISTEGKSFASSLSMLDYNKGTTTQFSQSPKSTETYSYVPSVNGVLKMYLHRDQSGNTFFVFVNDQLVANLPAYVTGGNVSLDIPLSKGDVCYVRTDSTSNTWVINSQIFYPLKGEI